MFSEGRKRCSPPPSFFWNRSSSHPVNLIYMSKKVTLGSVHLERTFSLIPARSSAPSSSPSTRRYLPESYICFGRFKKTTESLSFFWDNWTHRGWWCWSLQLPLSAFCSCQPDQKSKLELFCLQHTIEKTWCCSLSTKLASRSPAFCASSVLNLYSWIPGEETLKQIERLSLFSVSHLWELFCGTCWHPPISFSRPPAPSPTLSLAGRDGWPVLKFFYTFDIFISSDHLVSPL